MRMPAYTEAAGWDLYRAIVEQSQEAIIFADREGLIRLWNRGAEVLFGYEAASMLGRNLEVIVPEKFRRAHNEGFRKAVSAGQTRHEGRVLTTRACHKYGSRLYVDLSFGLLKDASGTVMGAYAIGRDATARYMEQTALRLRAEGHTG
ncbi:PAS domain S-box protein [Variovorax terrae]|uniref:PAS domain S-box protein n=1 Tax=Variovorax terrae TaxID=2923278 RepID=A0A9X1VR20_9BURK|nr:PAS domain S-box protein [Variovorax terrae]MCJ0761773.1 PAS domain S-box protein [Variovorax terrae]